MSIPRSRHQHRIKRVRISLREIPGWEDVGQELCRKEQRGSRRNSGKIVSLPCKSDAEKGEGREGSQKQLRLPVGRPWAQSRPVKESHVSQKKVCFRILPIPSHWEQPVEAWHWRKHSDRLQNATIRLLDEWCYLDINEAYSRLYVLEIFPLQYVLICSLMLTAASYSGLCAIIPPFTDILLISVFLLFHTVLQCSCVIYTRGVTKKLLNSNVCVCVFHFNNHFHIPLQTGCINLYSHEQKIGKSTISPHPSQH